MERTRMETVEDVVVGGLYKAHPAEVGAPGRVNSHSPHDQNYGLFVALRCEDGTVWMIDTYHIDSPAVSKDWEGDTRTDKFVNGFLASGEPVTEWFVNHCRHDCYYNACTPLTEHNAWAFEFVCDLGDYEVVEERESWDYPEEDIVRGVKLWREHKYPTGVILKRRGAETSAENKVKALIVDFENSIRTPAVYFDYSKLEAALAECPGFDPVKAEATRLLYCKLEEISDEWRRFSNAVRRLEGTGDMSSFEAWKQGVPVEDICA